MDKQKPQKEAKSAKGFDAKVKGTLKKVEGGTKEGDVSSKASSNGPKGGHKPEMKASKAVGKTFKTFNGKTGKGKAGEGSSKSAKKQGKKQGDGTVDEKNF